MTRKEFEDVRTMDRLNVIGRMFCYPPRKDCPEVDLDEWVEMYEKIKDWQVKLQFRIEKENIDK